MTHPGIDISLRVAIARATRPGALPEPVTRFRVAWDDEVYGTCRTQLPGYVGPTSPPAVWRYAPYQLPRTDVIGDYRVNISAWKAFFIALNNDATEQDFNYWTDPGKAQFNSTGWAQLAHLVMSGNQLRGERVGEWLRFETLKATDLERARWMNHENTPWFVHSFHCVSFRNGQAVRIESTGTARGKVYYPLISQTGEGWIPFRHIVEE